MCTTFRTVCNFEVMTATFPSEPLFPCSTCSLVICLAADGDRCPRCRQLALDDLITTRPRHTNCSCCSCPACHVAATPTGAANIAAWNAYAAAVDAQEDRRRAIEALGDIYVLPQMGAISGALFSRSLSAVGMA